MEITANHIHFFASYSVAFIAFGLIGYWYVWPAVRDRAPQAALSPLLLYACLRVHGVMFLMPGRVAEDLPRGFAVPTAYGDLTAVLLALLALWALRSDKPFAVPLLWLFNGVGLLDLVYANVATFTQAVDPAQLGASYYLAVLNVPAMIVVHIIIFAYLRRARGVVTGGASLGHGAR
jgi:hypothetical protein